MWTMRVFFIYDRFCIYARTHNSTMLTLNASCLKLHIQFCIALENPVYYLLFSRYSMVEVKRQKFLCLLLVYSANICLSIHMHVAHAHLQLTARPKLIYSNAWPKLGTRDTHATKGDTTVDKNRLGLLPQKKNQDRHVFCALL